MLRGNAQRRAVLHQADVVDVGHLGTADALVDPAHDIAQYALRIIVQLLRDLLFRPVAPGGDRDGQQLVERRDALRRALRLPREHVEAVIMGRVQRRGGGRWHPGGVGPAFRMADLLFQHIGHAIGRGPHALADLRATRQAAGEADLDVAILIGRDPVAALHFALADHRPGLHRRVHLIPGAIEEAGVDEDDAVAHGMDAGGEIGRGTALLIHDADLERVACHPQHVLDSVEQAIGKRRFVGSVHLGLDDIDATRAAVAAFAGQIVQRDQAGDDAVEYAFGRLRTIGQQDGGRRHQMADIADEQQATAGQRKATAIRCRISAVGVERAGHHRARLLERLGQVALHQPQPVGICRNLVRRIDRRDRILQIANGGQRRFEDDIGYACGISRADGMAAIENDFDMQAVVAEQAALLAAAQILAGIGEDDLVARKIGPTPIGEWDRIVQKRFGPGDDLRPARRVIALTRRRAGNRVGAVQRVVQTSPTRIGGVEQEAGVEDGDDQLRPGEPRHLVIDMLAADGEGRGFGNQIADLAQESLIGLRVMRLACPLLMPVVDLRLHRIAGFQQGDIVRREACEDVRSPCPEGGGFDAGAGQCLTVDEVGQRCRDLQPGFVDHAVGHHSTPKYCRHPRVGGDPSPNTATGDSAGDGFPPARE